MQRSIIDRIFPQPKQPLLPQYDDFESTTSIRLDEPPPRIHLHESPSTTSVRTSSSHGSKSLKATPFSASIVHHDDPFLPIERAAKTLQTNIQSFLDRQADALKDRLANGETENATSTGSRTPTPSVTSPSRSEGRSGTIPIRQPPIKKVTLRAARKGLARSMQELATLRDEELRIIQAESESRQHALQSVKDLEDQKEAVQNQIRSMESNISSSNANALRDEARGVQSEINELEHRLLELKLRHRHLINQAEQLESSVESELSSFRGTLAEIDKDTRRFLRRPPVNHGLAIRSTGQNSETNMYLLKPERRTTGMAKEQWTMETQTLDQRKMEVEAEKHALVQGEEIWRESVSQITNFERLLREQLASLTSSTRATDQFSRTLHTPSSSQRFQPVVTETQLHDELDSTISYLETRLSECEERGWNLLVCALGAELEAFYQARQLLKPSSSSDVVSSPPYNGKVGLIQDEKIASVEDDDGDSRDDAPSSDLLFDAAQQDSSEQESSSSAVLSPSVVGGSVTNGTSSLLQRNNNTHEIHHTTTTTAMSDGSNESLKATLKQFPPSSPPLPGRADTGSMVLKGGKAGTGTGTGTAKGISGGAARPASSEDDDDDDDPGPDFLLSH